MCRIHLSLALCLNGLLCASSQSSVAASETSAAPAGVQITSFTNRLRVEINGRLFTEYFFRDVPRPYCHPLIGPGGATMTRRFPMESPPGEEHDHPHHRSFWFTHGDVNGVDFWTEGTNTGKILHDGFVEITSGKDAGVIRTRNNWIAPDGRLICTDERMLRFFNRSNDAMFDFEITLRPAAGELVLGDTKEGTMAIRVAETMRVKPNPDNAGNPTGHILNSEGLRDADAWGKRAAWCDYSGPVGERLVGIAIFDHPQNPRHPTWWHVRDYGLFAANPFGRHEFEASLPRAGDLKIAPGQSVTFRYRIFLYEGIEDQVKVPQFYGDYTNASPAPAQSKPSAAKP